MKLNFKFKIKNLSGKEVDGPDELIFANKLLGNMLSQMNKGNSIKLFDWAYKLWNKGEIEIDSTDSEVLHELIDKSEFLTVLSKTPMLELIKKKKDEAK